MPKAEQHNAVTYKNNMFGSYRLLSLVTNPFEGFRVHFRTLEERFFKRK